MAELTPAAASRARADERPGITLPLWLTNARTLEIGYVVLITAVGALLRLWDLSGTPAGFHGDEAWTGIDARRILDEGWIGPYVTSALGQPSGPLYWTAAVFLVLPEDVFSVRFSQALFGVATIPVMYVAAKMMFDRSVAVFSTALLAGLMWHLHLTRTAFMVTSWPFMEMLVLALLWLAHRRQKPVWFALAGAALGLGVYSYNAYLLFLPVPFVAFAWWFFGAAGRDAKLQVVRRAALFGFAGLLVAMPMVRYVDDHYDLYRSHQRSISVMETDEWKSGSSGERIDLVWDRAKELMTGLAESGDPDESDGMGVEPAVGGLTMLLAVAGLGFAVWRVRNAAYAVLLAAVILLPWGALLSVLGGMYRRSFGLAPIICILAALPVEWLWNTAWRRGGANRWLASAAVALVCAYPGVVAARSYFGEVQDSPAMTYTFGDSLRAASEYVNDLPDGTYVYFYAGRWSYNYETRRFIAPDVSGVDRSKEFRGGGDGEAPLDLTIDREGPVAFVFIAPYLDEVNAVRSAYPGGEFRELRDGDEVLYRAYLVNGDANTGTAQPE